MSPEQPDESRLVRSAARGDGRAFETLVRLKRRQVVRTAYQITGEMEDARDVAQGVFLSVWKSLGKYDARRSFDTWLYRITVNAAIDHLRRRGPKGAIQPLPDESSDAELPAGGEGPDRAVDRQEIQRAFLRLAARLGPKQRAAFVLREIEGLNTSEVARVLGVRESTVRNHILQARRALRRGLIREYPSLVGAIPSTDRRREDDSEGEGGSR